MGQMRQVERQLETVVAVIETLDADLAAGRLGADEHRRRRAEREREAGRLLVTLRRAQREAEIGQGRRAVAPARAAWLRRPPVIAALGVLLLAIGLGAGATAARWSGGRPSVGALSADPVARSTGGQPLLTGQLDLQMLRLAATREDAPVASLLELAHASLDQRRLDEARQIYTRVLAREPRNAEAITHLGAVLYQEGRVDEALAKVEAALRIDPAYIHAHWDRTQYLFHAKRDFPAAIRAAEAFLQVLPTGPDAESVRALMAEARQKASAAPR